MILQLFRRLPTNEEFQKILDCFGLKSINDQKKFNLTYIKNFKTIHKLNKIKSLLKKLYIPCRYCLFENITYRRSITILRQFLRIYNRKLQRVIKTKRPYYNIICNCCKNKNLINIKKNITLKF
tara:strand:- start:345 stop:716 length:372 start_codon:yes stop_codon:yes gene_type:complete